MAKIIFEKEKCIGCGTCQALCPKYWELSDDGKVQLLGSTKKQESENYDLEMDKIGCNQDAADSCPVQCIRIQK